MPRELFQDLQPGRPGAAGWRALPASLAVHALAAAAMAFFVVRPVANAVEEQPTGVLRFFGAAPTPAPAAPRAVASAPRSKPQPVLEAGAPAPPQLNVVMSELLPTRNGTLDDTPAPCLTGCGDGSPGSVGVGPGAGAGGRGDDVDAGGGAPLPIGGDLRPPRKTQHVLPQYPELARLAGIGGVVIVQCVIGADGRVVDARVIRGHPLLDAAALEAVRQWRYEPTRLNGVTVPVVMTVTVTFQARK